MTIEIDSVPLQNSGLSQDSQAFNCLAKIVIKEIYY